MPQKIWNPTTGCSKISRGCDNCIVERMAKLHAARWGYPKADPFAVVTWEQRIKQPLLWKRPQSVLVNTRGDLFHQDVPDKFIKAVFGIMKHCERHTFHVITKRPERMYQLLSRHSWNIRNQKPLPNVFLGVSIDGYDSADEMIRLLLKTPASVRFGLFVEEAMYKHSMEMYQRTRTDLLFKIAKKNSCCSFNGSVV